MLLVHVVGLNQFEQFFAPSFSLFHISRNLVIELDN